MHSDIYELIWFELCMMIETAKLYILILVYVTLTLIQGYRDARKDRLYSNCLPKSLMGLVWNAVETCKSDESHVHVI